MKYDNLTLVRKPVYERCDIQRAASVTNTSMDEIISNFIKFGRFETERYLVIPHESGDIKLP